MAPSRRLSSHVLPDWVETALRDDPAYRVLTMDGSGWIDPFSGMVVPAPFGHEQAAKEYLKQGGWKAGAPKPLRNLLFLRWLYYLRENIEFVPLLRMTRGGQWLNPYTGRWEPGPSEEVLHQGAKLAEFLAGRLCDCVEAQTGRMLERWQLESLSAQGPQGSGAQATLTATPAAAHPIARPSGRLKPPEATPVKGSKIAQRQARTDFIAIKQAFVQQLRRPPRMEQHQIVLHFEPHASMPRDLYDFIEFQDGRLLTVLGHVFGSGPGVGLLAGTTLAAVRQHATASGDLMSLVCSLNEMVRADQVHGCSIALVALLLDPRTNRMTCLTAGHPPPLVASLRREVVLRRLRASGASLGSLMGADFRNSLLPIEMELRAGDVVMLPGRGLSHTADPEDPEAGWWKVWGSLVANLRKPLPDLAQSVVEVAKAGSAKVREDLTLIALRVKDGSWLMELRE